MRIADALEIPSNCAMLDRSDASSAGFEVNADRGAPGKLRVAPAELGCKEGRALRDGLLLLAGPDGLTLGLREGVLVPLWLGRAHGLVFVALPLTLGDTDGVRDGVLLFDPLGLCATHPQSVSSDASGLHSPSPPPLTSLGLASAEAEALALALALALLLKVSAFVVLALALMLAVPERVGVDTAALLADADRDGEPTGLPVLDFETDGVTAAEVAAAEAVGVFDLDGDAGAPAELLAVEDAAGDLVTEGVAAPDGVTADDGLRDRLLDIVGDGGAAVGVPDMDGETESVGTDVGCCEGDSVAGSAVSDGVLDSSPQP